MTVGKIHFFGFLRFCKSLKIRRILSLKKDRKTSIPYPHKCLLMSVGIGGSIGISRGRDRTRRSDWQQDRRHGIALATAFGPTSTPNGFSPTPLPPPPAYAFSKSTNGDHWNPRGHLQSLLPIEIDRRSPKEAPSEEEEDGEQDNIPPDNNGGRI